MSRMKTFFGVVALMVLAAPATAQQFEEPKQVVTDLDGIRLDWGAALMQSFQALDHSNSPTEATPANTLADIGAGFNLAAANLSLAAQLTPGIKVVLESYMSSRHHNEFWVKGGYLQIDESPIEWLPLQFAMSMLTLKAGHYEVNYGDAHFRRTDNGNGINNPFAENLILDAFTTEIGGEVIGRVGPFLGVLGVTSGQNKGDITAPDQRSWAFITKLGVDHAVNDDLRVRLTGSTYQNDNAGRATLYGGDRAGSAYWGVMDVDGGTSFTNGRINPNFSEEISALQINPFVKYRGLELFGVMERAEGRTIQEQQAGLPSREVTQYAVDGVYRFLEDALYVAARYNTVNGQILAAGEQTVDRFALGAGWFISPNILAKLEYVTQKYDGWAGDSILHGGKFNGFVVQGAVAF